MSSLLLSKTEGASHPPLAGDLDVEVPEEEGAFLRNILFIV